MCEYLNLSIRIIRIGLQIPCPDPKQSHSVTSQSREPIRIASVSQMPIGFRGTSTTETASAALRTVFAAKGFCEPKRPSVKFVSNAHTDIEFGTAIAAVDLVDPLAVIGA